MKLPTKKSKPKTVNPRFLVLFGKPKSGKTTIASMLDNNLIVDINDGSDYVSGLIVKASDLNELMEVSKAIKEANCPYEYITIDTATDLEEMVLPLAQNLYQKTPMGKNFGLDPKTGKYRFEDVRSLPNGAGYLYLREAFFKVINTFRKLTPHLILLAHTKDKNINRQGKELFENTIDLSGKLERLVAAESDALGYIYRDKNKTIINFNGGEDSIVEARPPHLRGKEIVIAESDENNNITAYWDRIFIKNND